jgi:hypothetical protein
MKTFSHVEQYLAEFFLEWELFQIKVLEKIKTHISHSVTFVWKYCHLWDKVKKCGAREVTDNMVHACCVLVKWCYMHERTNPCLHSCTHIHQPPPPHTHTQKCIILTVFPWEKWFCECASALNYTYIAFLVKISESFVVFQIGVSIA